MASNSDKDSPPPPSDDNSSSPPPSQDNSSSSSNNNNSPSPSPSPPPPPPPPPPDKDSSGHRPPPPPRSGHDFSPPPPPPPPSHHRLSPPKSSSSHSDGSGDSGSLSLSMPVIIGIAAGAGILFLLLLLLLCACSRKKKRSQTSLSFYANQSDDGYYKRGPNDYGYNNKGVGVGVDEHVMNIPPPPGAGWGGAAPQRISSNMSNSSYSGPQGPVLPPPHPTVALGFNQSSFTYDELSSATAGFSQRNLLGQGGFGYVHKGVLPNGKEIAVKSLMSTGSQGDREFQAEVDIISRVHHRHLVSLVGYCLSDTKKLLVYEFVPNNTLQFHLHAKGRPVLDWATRLKIAIGSAKGLAYLHEDCHPRIIHRDIKGANILLENNFEAKVADFGLAKISQDTNTHVSTRVMGTLGYLAPEYASSGKLTDKSDVFSFGVMLLELVTGRRPVNSHGESEDNLVDWARPLCTKAMENGTLEGLVDPRLEDNYDRQQMASMVACAAVSIRYTAKKRPRMSQIVRVLEGDVSIDVLSHEGVKPGQSAMLSSESGEYGDADMSRFRKLALNSGMGSSEYGGTSEYGLNPSISSSEQSSMEYSRRIRGRMHTP